MVYVLAATVFILASLQNVASLRCWSCSSDLDVTCMDHFNTTKIQHQNFYFQNPGSFQKTDTVLLKSCDDQTGRIYNRKAVCMKKEQTVPGGRQIVIRQCMTIPESQPIGRCPTEPTGRQVTIDFCEYCDYDGCNSATGLKFNLFLAALAPLSILFLRK